MRRFRRGVFACALVATLAVSMSAVASVASDREPGPRDPGNRPTIAKIVAFIIHTFSDISFPPPH